jgi:2,5-diketo-D-gluconate reductase A
LNFRPSPGFDFSLIDYDMNAISGLDRAEIGRTGPNPDEFDYIPYASQCD